MICGKCILTEGTVENVFFNVRLSILDVPGYIKGKIGSRWEYTGICGGKIPQGLGH